MIIVGVIVMIDNIIFTLEISGADFTNQGTFNTFGIDIVEPI